MRILNKRRVTAIGAAGALAASSLGIMALGGGTAFASTATQQNYEVDCSTTLTTPSTRAPFVLTINGNLNPDPAFFNGTALVGNLNGGAVSVIGAFLGGLDVSPVAGASTYSVQGSVNWGPTNANITGGPYNSGLFLTSTLTSDRAKVADAATTAGSPIMTSATGFVHAPSGLPIAVGEFVSSAVAANVPAGTIVGPGSTANSIVMVNPATLAAQPAAATTVGQVAAVNATKTFPIASGLDTTAKAFTTAAGAPGSSGIQVVSANNNWQVNGSVIPAPFNDPLNPCAVTGGGTGVLPAAQAPAALPSPFATVALNDTAPTPNGIALLNVGTGTTGNPVTLTATDADTTKATTFLFNTIPAAGTLFVGATPVTAGSSFPNSGPNSLAITYNAPATVGAQSFTFSVGDVNNPPGATATVNFQVGTPPVDQPIRQVVNGGQLTLSCAAPPAAVVTVCPLITMAPITLSGVAQQTTAAINPIYVSDNRGDPSVGWALTTYMTQNGTFNTNPNCATATDFCMQTLPAGGTPTGAQTALSTSHIASANLSIAAVGCVLFLNPTGVVPATINGPGGTYGGAPIPLCSAAAPNAAGSFRTTGTFSLNIPSTTNAGAYIGVVEYLVV